MGGLAAWMLATVALLPALAIAVVRCAVGPVPDRVVAAQVVAALSIIILIAMSVAFELSSSIDLALTSGVLTLPASLLFALFVERWL